VSAASGAGKGLPGDAEASTHGDEAASLQLVQETERKGSDFLFRQYNLGVLSHYSYLIASEGQAMVVDPARDIARYLKDADQLGVRITTVYLTHSHADFVAGHTEFIRATNAVIVVNAATKAGYPHRAVKEGDEIVLGKVRGVVVETPGHTPDGTCLYVHHPSDAKVPKLVLTGDTLFIGSVGRPDLLGKGMSAATLAEMGFRSWKDKLSKLPDDVEIYPAHGAGSLCGAHLSDKPVSTFGEQKRVNPYLQYNDLSGYVMSVVDGLPEAPQYFAHNAKINHDGPPLVDWSRTEPKALSPAEASAAADKGAWIVDVRDAKAFSSAHPRNAINIGIRGRFETWTGIMVTWADPFILVGSDEDVREAAFRLHRIGYDDPAGYLAGGVAAWQKAGLPSQSVQLVKPAELHKQMQAGAAPIILDVRLPSEWMGIRIGQTLNIPISKLATDHIRLDPRMPVLAVCNSAYRSSMAAGVLQKAGFADVRNLEGGGEAWIEAGLPTLGSGSAHGEASAGAPAGVKLNLPEIVSPEDLARRVSDLPGSFDIVDVRPAWQFAEYHIAGSVNMPPERAMSNPALVADTRPLVLVCRDGLISAAIAGQLVQKGQRPIRVLAGGVARYHDEIERPAGIASSPTPMKAPAAAAPSATPAPAREPSAPAPIPAPAPAAPKKKSAGC
jgi:rhodanese-related sulfurtransferase/glyoxylase-like metal-dependent hydrolase (beta-lactamase superfamily II)